MRPFSATFGLLLFWARMKIEQTLDLLQEQNPLVEKWGPVAERHRITFKSVNPPGD